jgi:putative ABC transport system ATP-binding protein
VLTALIFILVQNLALGLIAAGMVLVQGAIIPRLRREQIRLGKQRQIASRAFAGKVGEVVETLGEVSNHGTSAVERSLVAQRLEQLFGIRYRLFERKFAVKTLNNLLAQITPFLYFAVGGYFALNGRLDLGQLVAVIAAYRDLPPPVKDLIDWDQQRLDVEAKFEQVVEHFSLNGEALPPDAGLRGGRCGRPARSRVIAAQRLTVVNPSGDHVLDRLSLSLPLQRHIALSGGASEGAGSWRNCWADPERKRGLADHCRDSAVDLTPRRAARNRLCRARAGHSRRELARQHSLRPAPGGARLRNRPAGPSTIAGRMPPTMPNWRSGWSRCCGRRTCRGRVRVWTGPQTRSRHPGRSGAPHFGHPRPHPCQARRARADIAIEPYDPGALYAQRDDRRECPLRRAGRPALVGARLASHEPTRQLLAGLALTETLDGIGRRIAATMLEIFRDLAPGHVLFEQFSFIAAEDFQDYRESAPGWRPARAARPTARG